MSFDTFRVHNVIVEIRVVRANARASDFGDKIFTPRHSLVPSLTSKLKPAAEQRSGTVCAWLAVLLSGVRGHYTSFFLSSPVGKLEGCWPLYKMLVGEYNAIHERKKTGNLLLHDLLGGLCLFL
jgi:hypothetical protein